METADNEILGLHTVCDNKTAVYLREDLMEYNDNI